MTKRIETVDVSQPGQGSYLQARVIDEPEYLTGGANGQPAEDVTSLEDFFAKSKPKRDKLVLGGRVFHFKGGSPKARDALLAKHRKDDGMGNTTVEESMWMTDAIALTWVTGPESDTRVLDSAEKANRFHAQADADDEKAMYDVAKRMLGLGAKDERDALRKNSNGDGGIATLPTSPSASSTLYPENS